MNVIVVGFGLLWAIVCLITSALLARFWWSDRTKDDRRFDMVPILATNQFMEGAAFVLYAITQANGDSQTWLGVFNCIQVVNAGNIWAIAIGQTRAGSAFNAKKVWTRFLIASCACGVMLSLLTVLDYKTASLVLFLICFEPPLMISLSAQLGLAGTLTGSAGRWAVVQFLGKLTGILAHFYTIMVTLDFASKQAPYSGADIMYKNESFMYTRIGVAIGTVAGNIGFFMLMKLSVFTAQPPKVPDNRLIYAYKTLEERKEIQRRTEAEGWKSYYVQPETVLSSSPIFQLLAYFLCALIIFGYVKPTWAKDPIYNLYATMHPCVLLDYIPANLVAMPLFTFNTILGFSGVCLNFLRWTLMGDLVVTLACAFMVGYFLLAGCAFVLVFVYPPSISTLGHSIFYMFNSGAMGLFMFTMGLLLLYRGSRFPAITFRRKQWFIGYVIASVALVIYGLDFMGRRLLDDHAGRWVPPKVGEPIRIDYGPQIGSIIFILIAFSYRFASPFTKYPLIFLLKSTSEAYKQPSDPEASWPKPFWGFFDHFNTSRIQLRRPLGISAFFIFLAMILGVWVNTATYTSDVVGSWTLREFMRTLPGAAIVAPLLVPAQICLLLHVILTIEHEWHNNPNVILRRLSIFLGIAFSISSLCASSATIPSPPTNSTIETQVRVTMEDLWWYRPAELFEGLLCCWLVLHIALTFQMVCANWKPKSKGYIELQQTVPHTSPQPQEKGLISQDKKRLLFICIDTISAGVCIVFLLFSMCQNTVKCSAVWIVSLQVWAACDARQIVSRIECVSMGTQTEADNFATPYFDETPEAPRTD